MENLIKWDKSRWFIAALIGILVLGIFLRFFWLTAIPPGLYPDEAMNGLDALHTLDRADYRVFYTDNNGREGLYMNMQALAMQIFGRSAWTLRAVSAAAGALTILGFAFLAYEIGILIAIERKRKDIIQFAQRTALLAATFLSVSVWHIHFSRIGFRAILLPLFMSLLFAWIFRAIRRKSRGDAMWAGAMLALSLSTYIASRTLPLLILFPILFDIFKTKAAKETLKRWALFVVVFLIVLLPLLAYFVTNPADFTGRAGDVSIFTSDNPAIALVVSTVKTALMFNVLGDWNWRHGVVGLPVLDPLLGIAFLVGGLLMLVRLKTSNAYRFMFLWLGAMLAPAAMTTEGLPHALRAFGAVLPVLLLAALGSLWAWERLRPRITKSARVSIIAILLLVVLGFNTQRYFFSWATATAELDGAFRGDLTRVAEYLIENKDFERYVIINEGGVLLDDIPMPSATLRFLTRDDETITYLTEADVTNISPSSDESLILVTDTPSDKLDTELRNILPEIERKEGDGFTIYQL